MVYLLETASGYENNRFPFTQPSFVKKKWINTSLRCLIGWCLSNCPFFLLQINKFPQKSIYTDRFVGFYPQIYR